jgi:uncharacterized protein involved in outer membrane biogenesis
VRFVKWTVGIFLVLVVSAVAVVFFTGFNALRGPAMRIATEKTGRELVIGGDFKPVWSWIHPRVRLENVTFANPDWAQEDYLLKAEAIEITISGLNLFRGRLTLPEVHLVRPEINLETSEDGKKNWLLDREQKNEKSRVFIKRLTFDEGRITYADAANDTAVDAELSTQGDGIVFTASGKLNGLPLQASGSGAQVLALRDETTPYPIKAEAKIGTTRIRAGGTVTDLADLGALNMSIQLSGESMERLYPIIGIALPDTKAYQTDGRVVHEGTLWRYENFSGKVGSSDLSGTLQVDTGGKRPFMQGDLTSKVLDLADLGPLVGTNQPAKSGVLPDAPFQTERWDSVDADVKIKAGTIRRPEQLPLENLSTRIKMRDAVLTLDPLEFGTAGGKITGPVKLDGRNNTIKADMRLRVQNLDLAKLFPTIKVTKASVGKVSGAIELTGTGNSVAKMLGSANGKVGVFVDSGEVSEFLMQAVAIDLWGIARVKLQGDKQVPIRCVIGDFGVKDGLMQTNALVFDTEVVNVGGQGSINLKNESLDLTFRPEPKDKSLASLRSPLHVRGTFSAPKVAPEWDKMVVRGAGALVMGVLNPLLAVLPLIDEGPGKDSQCGKLIADITSSSRIAATAAKQQRKPAVRSAENAAAAGSTSSSPRTASAAQEPRPPSQSSQQIPAHP